MEKKQFSGFYQKYIVEKADGSDIDPSARYFILRLDIDSLARAAAHYYAMRMLQEIDFGLFDETDRCNREFAEQLRNHCVNLSKGARHE